MTSVPDHPRILVVDDSPFIENPIEVALERIGCAVVAPARPMGEALSFLEADAFDVALLDVEAAQADCFAVADACLEAGFPLAFISGEHRRDLPVLFAACPILRKPITDKELRQQIHALLNHEEITRSGLR